jgi:hypothetical protein
MCEAGIQTVGDGDHTGTGGGRYTGGAGDGATDDHKPSDLEVADGHRELDTVARRPPGK